MIVSSNLTSTDRILSRERGSSSIVKFREGIFPVGGLRVDFGLCF
jgi:hypothetical protein